MGKQTESFSKNLQRWLKGPDTTLGSLNKVFAEKSFAVIFLLMMALPALPLPTGGVTHITELITILVSLQLIAGRRVVWLPNRWLKTDAGKLLKGAAGQRLIRLVVWFEKLPGRRGGWLNHRAFRPAIGFVVLAFTLAAFVAPPFSGLDTLPSLGVVAISLAIIFENLLILLGGILIGSSGIILEITAGTAIYKGLTHFF